MSAPSPRLRAVAAALLVSGLLAAGCEAEPATTTDTGEEQPLPGEPDAPEPVETPEADEVPDAEDPTEGQDG